MNKLPLIRTSGLGQSVGKKGYCPFCKRVMEYIGYGSAWDMTEYICKKDKVRVRVSKL